MHLWCTDGDPNLICFNDKLKTKCSMDALTHRESSLFIVSTLSLGQDTKEQDNKSILTMHSEFPMQINRKQINTCVINCWKKTEAFGRY